MESISKLLTPPPYGSNSTGWDGPSEVMSEIEAVRHSLSLLTDQIAQLEDRLAPVLAPVNSGNAGPMAPTKLHRVSESSAGAQLTSITETVEALSGKVAGTLAALRI